MKSRVRLLCPLRADYVLTPKERCEATVRNADGEWMQKWRHKQGYGPTCQRVARVEVDGIKLCELHGGKIALRILSEK